MAAARAAGGAASSAFKILNASKLPDFARLLPSDAAFRSAQKSTFLKCNKAEATTVLSIIWRTTREQGKEEDRIKAVEEHNFPISNLTSLALLIGATSPSQSQSPSPSSIANLRTDLLTLAESLNEPAAILRAARSKISSSRSILILENTAIWKKLLHLARVDKIPEAWDLIADTLKIQGERKKAHEAWIQGAETGSGRAYLELGKAAVNQKEGDVAVEYFRKAGELGQAAGYYELGLLLEKEDGEQAEAEHSFLVAAASGYQKAAERLARFYKVGGDELRGGEWEEVAKEMAIANDL
ncbi:hypothetical protein ABW19_dt0209323 [Dactylella cylindrospora]|nr:hypothetical protein ABW19_dt0209323 [Dactylella cylindrospora]